MSGEGESSAPRTLRVLLEYDGTRFAGWQRQAERGAAAPEAREGGAVPSGGAAGVRTVQGTLEAAIEKMTGEKVITRAASRTDAGVHARGQVVAFSTSRWRIPLYGFERGLNSNLPDDVAVREVTEVAAGWNPRFESRGKRYRYTLWNDRLPTALGRHRAWWVRRALDLEEMQRGADHFLGTHDLEAFRSAGCPARHAIRTMYAIKVARGEHSEVEIDVTGNAFCRNMVRIMVGTLKVIGEGALPADAVREIIRGRDRTRAGMTAPPEGLCLEEVIFDDRLPPRPMPARVEEDEP